LWQFLSGGRALSLYRLNHARDVVPLISLLDFLNPLFGFIA
jgi:hypothetical protein